MHVPRVETDSPSEKTSFFEVRVHVQSTPNPNLGGKTGISPRGRKLPAKNHARRAEKPKNSTSPRTNKRKKPPAGRNLFYLAPPPLASLAPAGLRSIFEGKKGDFFHFFLNFPSRVHVQATPNPHPVGKTENLPRGRKLPAKKSCSPSGKTGILMCGCMFAVSESTLRRGFDQFLR